MSFLNILRVVSILVCVTGVGSGCDSGAGAVPSTTDTTVTATPDVIQPTPDPVEPAPVLVPIVQPSPSPTPSGSPSPLPSAVPVTTFAYNARGFCDAIESWDSRLSSLKLYSLARNYYYLFAAAGVTSTLVNSDGSDGSTFSVSEVILNFTNQLNVGSNAKCTVTVYDGQIVSIE